MGCFMLLYMLKECHISIMRAQLLINMIIKWVSKICELVPYTDINPLLRRQLILLNVLIYDAQAVWNVFEGMAVGIILGNSILQ